LSPPVPRPPTSTPSPYTTLFRSANNAQVDIPELDDMLVQAEETTDDGERADLYEQAQQIVLEDYYVLPLYDQQNHFLYSADVQRSEEHTSELQSRFDLVCRLLLE